MAGVCDQVRLTKTREDGSTLLRHYQSLAKTNSPGFEKVIAEAKAEVAKFNYVPPGMFNEVYNTFWDLRSGTPHDQPISYTEILSYTTLTGIKLTTTELDLIKRIETAYFKEVASKKE